MSSKWPDYHRDGGNREGMADRLAAEALQPLIIHRWKNDFRSQKPALRRPSLSQKTLIMENQRHKNSGNLQRP